MAADASQKQLGVSWHDSAWIPSLSPANVLDYFSQRTNPFYDRTCNNEVVKMQRLDPATLLSMTGIEYSVIHVQDPILFVIRKQHRHSATQVTPMADYYILAGIVYQAPDLCSVVNSRMLSALHNFQSAFKEAVSYSRYHPSKGYWWQFKETQKSSDSKQKKEPAGNQETSSLFQREGVNLLLGELSRRFPPNFLKNPQTTTTQIKKEPETITEEATNEQTDATSRNSELAMNGTQPVVTQPRTQGGTQTTQLGTKRGMDGGLKQPPVKRKKQ
ncbi:mediator of RNA polymerase II transcription subunit 6 [Nematostella vectensis]|uniref:mediator of RNA polymerase II transcription subunit 6 n=1 Tax=Nematostella vectensis TaxID=45351 RepID=UPI0020778413|nr:mediator of RNA polymerase II transcription subunit 6 [Nematostella vectensis]